MKPTIELTRKTLLENRVIGTIGSSTRSSCSTNQVCALRSPIRPNPVSASLVTLVEVHDDHLVVRGLDSPARAMRWFALAGNTVLTRAAYERFGPLDEVRGLRSRPDGEDRAVRQVGEIAVERRGEHDDRRIEREAARRLQKLIDDLLGKMRSVDAIGEEEYQRALRETITVAGKDSNPVPD